MDFAVLRSHYTHSQKPKAVHWKLLVIMFRHVFLSYEIMQVFPIYLLISLPLTEIEMYIAMKLPLHVRYVQALSIGFISAAIGWWVTFDPAKSPLLLSGTCCVLTLLNIIPNVSKRRKHMFISALSSKFSRYYVYISIFMKILKVFFRNCINLEKIWPMWGITSKKMSGGRYFWL